MPPFDNRMQVGPATQGGMQVGQMGPGGQMGMPGGMNPEMIQQLMQQYAQMQGGQGQAQQMGMIAQKPMQSPGGYPNLGGGLMARNDSMQVQPGFDPMQQGPAQSGPFMPPGMDPATMGSIMQKPMRRPMESMPTGGQMPPQAPQRQAPPPPRLPPNAGVYRNPGTGAMMNETPRFSGQVNPATLPPVDKPSAPQTGGAMTMPAGPASDAPADPIRMAVPATKIQGSPPFNQTPADRTNRIRQTTGFAAEADPGATKQGAGWQGSAQEQKKKAGLAQAMTSRVTKPATK